VDRQDRLAAALRILENASAAVARLQIVADVVVSQILVEEPATGPAVPDEDEWVAAQVLARRTGLGRATLTRRLAAFRAEPANAEHWVENPNPRPRESRYLYRAARAIHSLLAPDVVDDA
jgi:hypothetical protein